MSKLKQLKDLINRLLMISDPRMLEFVKEKAFKNRKVRKLSPEIREMLADPENENFDQHFFFNDDDEVEELQQELFDGQLLEDLDEVGEDIENSVDNDDDYVDMSDSEESVHDEPSTFGQAKVDDASNEVIPDRAMPSTSGMQRQKRNVSKPVRYRESSSMDQDDENKDTSQDLFDNSNSEFEMNPSKRQKLFSSDESD